MFEPFLFQSIALPWTTQNSWGPDTFIRRRNIQGESFVALKLRSCSSASKEKTYIGLFGGSTFIKYVCRSVEAEFCQRSEILILDLLSWQGKYSMVSLFYQSSQYYSCTCFFSFLYFRFFKNFEFIFQRQVIRFSFTFLKSIALFVSTIIAKFLKDLKTFAFKGRLTLTLL